MLGGVFVCHAAEDAGTAQRVVATLEAANVPCWIAPRDIRPGRSCRSDPRRDRGRTGNGAGVLRRRQQVQACLPRGGCRRRPRAADRLGLRLEQVQPSPKLSYFIAEAQWLDADRAGPQQWESPLVQAVRDAVQQTPPTRKIPAIGGQDLNGTGHRRRWWLWGGAGAALLLVAGLLVVLLEALGKHRELFRFTVQGLTDEQAARTPTTSALCLGGLIKHVSFVESGWVDFIIEGTKAMESSEGSYDAHTNSFRMLEGETLEGILADYEKVARAHRRAASAPSTSTCRTRCRPLRGSSRARRWSARRAFVHIVAETAQHAGHADIIREAIDGQKSMG